MSELQTPQEQEPDPNEEALIRTMLEQAIAREYIDESDLEHLGEDMNDIVGSLYGIIIEHGDDPDVVLSEWGVLAENGETE